MLIPKFSIRSLLGLMTVSAFFFLVVSLAVQGKTWAVSTSLAIASVLVAFTLYVAFFGVAFIFAAIVGGLRVKPQRATPFATSEPPPQLVPPQEPDTL